MCQPLIIGHRGTADAPENTLASFRSSVEQGSEMLELDVRLTRDGIPVVVHDSTLRRVSGGSGAISSRTLKHLRNIDVGAEHHPDFTGETIPTLEEALAELCPRVPIDIELKFNKPNYRPLVEGVVEVVERLGVHRQVMISSFWHEALRHFQRALPGVLTAPLFSPSFTGPPHPHDLEQLALEPLRTETPQSGEVPFSGRVMITNYRLARAELLTELRAIGGHLLVYTVDVPADMAKMIRLGLDGIITNRPALLRLVREEMS